MMMAIVPWWSSARTWNVNVVSIMSASSCLGGVLGGGGGGGGRRQSTIRSITIPHLSTVSRLVSLVSGLIILALVTKVVVVLHLAANTFSAAATTSSFSFSAASASGSGLQSSYVQTNSYKYRRMLLAIDKDTQRAFTKVYAGSFWGSGGGGSGAGSTLQYTKPLRALLKRLVETLGIDSLVDIPCGAATWQDVLVKDLLELKPNFRYHGMEIVKSLVDASNQRWKGDKRVTFEVADMANTPVPSGYDAIFSRDALQHNGYTAIIKTLQNWARSDAKYLLVGSYPATPYNRDIKQAGVNHFDIDLAKFPFNLKPWKVHIENSEVHRTTDQAKHLYVYKIEELRNADFDAMRNRAKNRRSEDPLNMLSANIRQQTRAKISYIRRNRANRPVAFRRPRHYISRYRALGGRPNLVQ